MDRKMKIIPIASDHAGYEMKQFLIQELEKQGYEINDYGTHSTESVDYPDYIHPLASDMNKGLYDLGIVLCGSGNGVQIVANKYQQVRCALCWIPEIAKLARQHNNANILSLPARFVDKELALGIVKLFLETPFEGGRHQARVDKIAIRPC